MENPLIKLYRSKISTALILLILLLFVGVIGFKIISDFSWVDAFYMTVITITTVGFGEVLPLDSDGKLFTILLILTSVIIVGYALKVITEYIISKNVISELKHKKMQKKIDALSNHIVICGFGRNGQQAAKKLRTHNRTFVVVESNKELIDKHQNEDILFVYGNANDDDVLQSAGIERAECLISALPNDSDNVFVVLSARQMNKTARIISRASNESSYSKLKFAGANNVILPDKIGGDHMASLVVVPDLLEFIDNLSIVGHTTINIEEIAVEKLYDTSDIKTIQDLELRKKTGCSVIGYKDETGHYTINPEASQKLVPNSRVIVLGRPEQILNLNSTYNIDLNLS
ncbi:MAG: potassium channel protein [Flavobacteriaceae bacterium]|jgi:voltage-gated potassium channel|nr:potassium channel protein [Formosa sp.]MDG1375227.1 potassium channel protein [Flavobacteriaceae bacterium]MDG2498043.1 potassium channel protein [Flavobacteriaceae bacterium]